MTSKNVELDSVWLILAAVVGAYVFLFGFLKKINEWYYVFRLGKKKHLSLPPGDMGWPFVGNMISFLRAFRSKDPDSFINNLVHRYGRTGIYKTSLFGNPSVIVCGPELSRKILLDDERFEAGYPSSLMKLLGTKSLLGAANSEHRRLRKLLVAPINGHEALSMYIGYIEDIVKSSLEECANYTSPIEFLTEWKKISFNVITKIFLGSADSVSESMTEHYGLLLQGAFSPLPFDVPGFMFHRALKARKILLNFIQPHLDERRYKNGDDQNIENGIIDQLLEAKDGDGEKLENELIVNLLFGFLLAGHETAAHVGVWLTILPSRSSRNPTSCQGRTRGDCKEETILTKGLNSQRNQTDGISIKVDGYIIPKGWKVLVWNRGIHKDSEIYSNPNEFLPSRWDNHTPKAGSFMPFGAGSRTCPGADLAKIEMCIFIHYFLLNYRFERINPKSPVKFPSVSPIDNCVARITKLP
ncbi:putative Anthranilate N-benzoyltransferase protein [Hibiscus syriacus]|uniref:Anthranilate N-benzoyltransferase protein n=1 Tax=Hibiscus syriacus TaxID=106335 RepID=A0A6A3D9R3_HIBSY|nr:putative Anthranilate N-benzoyltransferase protein [Hibiscus syriacus]